MNLVLCENIRGLGSTGDLVKVRDGYARNYLLPHKLAAQPTEANLKRLRKAREDYLLREKDRIGAASIIAKRMDGLTLSVTMKSNDAGQLFGSVTEQIVAEALSKAIATEIRPQQVILGSHYKRIGDYLCAVRLHSEVEIELPLHVEPELSEEQLAAAAALAQLEAEEAAAAAEAGEEDDGES